MQKHHDALLNHALDRLYRDGAVSISWDDLYTWFNVDRLNKGAYREIKQRWEELCTTNGHSHAPALFILQPKNNYPYLLRISREHFKGEEQLVPFDSAT